VKPFIHSQQPGIVIYRPVDATGDSHRRLELAGCRVHIAGENDDLDQVLVAARPVHAILAATLRGIRLDRARLESLPDLRIVAKYTIGVDDVDLDAATELGILVMHSPTEANYGGVAEGAIALMLALLKKLGLRDRAVRSGRWRSEDLFGTYLGAREDGYPGITVGIIGLGRIGRRVAELLAPWKITLLATDPYIDSDVFSRYGATAVDLNELLRRSDVVSLHCQLTAETARLIDRHRLASMKPGAVLLNTARGQIVDIEAVCDALDAGRLGGVALDVFPDEPPPANSRILLTDARVILSPHMVAANQGGTLGAAVPWVTEAVCEALAGRVPERVYNGEAIATWLSRFKDRPLLADRQEGSPDVAP
jgi:phosphoglycerate dehydrogenase-like enzyme